MRGMSGFQRTQKRQGRDNLEIGGFSHSGFIPPYYRVVYVSISRAHLLFTIKMRYRQKKFRWELYPFLRQIRGFTFLND